VPLNGSHC